MAADGKYVFKLDESLKKKAEEELFETDDNRNEKISKLREKVKQNKGINSQMKKITSSRI